MERHPPVRCNRHIDSTDVRVSTPKGWAKLPTLSQHQSHQCSNCICLLFSFRAAKAEIKNVKKSALLILTNLTFPIKKNQIKCDISYYLIKCVYKWSLKSNLQNLHKSNLATNKTCLQQVIFHSYFVNNVTNINAPKNKKKPQSSFWTKTKKELVWFKMTGPVHTITDRHV